MFGVFKVLAAVGLALVLGMAASWFVLIGALVLIH